MTPKPPPSVVPLPNFAVPPFNFPNDIQGRAGPPPSNFLLLPEVTPQAWPVTPPIPPTVQTGDVITASHENTVSTAINDLWIDLQSLGASAITDPTQATGDLIVREGGVLSRLPIGATGTLLTADTGQSKGMRWGTLASTGAVPSSRQVLAGTGMTGGGPLTADVTLNAKVTSVNGQIGAVVLTPADITGAVPSTRTILPADATLIGGGDLSANRTFQVAPDTSIQKIRYSKDGALVGTRREVNLIPGANVTISVTDDAANNRINVNLAAAGGGSGGMVDPTVNPGDLIVRGTSTTTNLPVGTAGQVLTVDTSLGAKMKWAAQATGVAPTRRVDTTAPALTGGGDLTADLILTVNPDTIVQKHITSYNGTLVGTRRETNFIPGSNVSLVVVDDGPNNRVNVTISSTAVGGNQTPWTSDINAAGFTLFSAGKVGIGIALPQAPLHVVSSSVTTAMIETTAASSGFATLNLKTATSFWQVAAGGAGSGFDGCWYVYSQTGAVMGPLVTASGYVGVGMTGTNKPNSMFQVGVGSPLASGIADFYGPNRTLAAGTALVNILSTDAAAADKGGTLGLGGVSGSPSAYAFAILAGRSESAAGPYAGYFQLSTVNAASAVTERMRVTSAGMVGINQSGPVERLHLSGGNVLFDFFGDAGTTENLAQHGIFFRAGFSPAAGVTESGRRNSSITTGAGTSGLGDAIDINGSNHIAFFTSGANERMRIDGAGGVGIGTVTASSEAAIAKLVVTGTIAGQGSGNLAESNTKALISFRTNVSSGYTLAIGCDNVNSFPYLQAVNWNGGAASAYLLLNPFGGNAGIGTTLPGAILHLNQSVASGYLLRLQAASPVGNYGFAIDNSTGYLALDDIQGAARRITLTTTGNVSIGSTVAAYKLDVSGDINCTGGAYRLNGNPILYGWSVTAGALTLGARADVPGLTHTVPYGGRYLVIVTCNITVSADRTNLGRFYLVVGGATQAYYGEFGPGSDWGAQAHVTANWMIVVAAGTVVKVQGERVGGSGSTITSNSYMSLVWVSPG